MTDFKAKMHQIRFRAGEEEGKGEEKGREGNWREGKGEPPSYC